MVDGGKHYIKHLVSVLPQRLDGLHVVLDTAHGAASQVAPEAFRAAGAKVTQIGGAPDGWNINDGCGSTHLEPLQAAVLANEAHLGIALDGDASSSSPLTDAGRSSTAITS